MIQVQHHRTNERRRPANRSAKYPERFDANHRRQQMGDLVRNPVDQQGLAAPDPQINRVDSYYCCDQQHRHPMGQIVGKDIGDVVFSHHQTVPGADRTRNQGALRA